jgi:hypothetical protein
MATERQIEANRKNAERSTGPKSTERTRLNATKHGLAGQLPESEVERSPEFEQRRAKWEPIFQPEGDDGQWALEKVVAASLRIDRCERSVDQLCDETAERARLSWSEDRAVEAATVFSRLGKDPTLASFQLQTTAAGAWLMIEAWLVLIEALEQGGWSESERSRALDLLGVAHDQRNSLTAVDNAGAADLIAFRRDLASEEVARLEALREEALIPLEQSARRRALTGDSALLTKPAKLLLRYERDAWRRYREAVKELKSPKSTTAAQPSTLLPPPLVIEPPKPPKPPAAPAKPSAEEQERRAVLAEARQILAKAGIKPMAPIVPDEEDAWLDALEARIEALPDARSFVTERSQFVDFAVGLGS